MGRAEDAGSQLGLTFVEDGVRAVVPAVHARTTVAEINELLEHNGVSVGISQHRIRLAVRTAHRTNRTVRDVVVAEGTRPRAPSRPRLVYHTPEGLDAPELLSPIQDLLAEEWDETIRRAPDLLAWAVGPGDCLAVIGRTDGMEGQDVRGETIPIPEPPEETSADLALEPGPGVELGPNGTDYVASTSGYAGLDEGRISVLEPLWIAPDMMQACFLNLPRHPGSSSPCAADLHALLEASGISCGVEEEAIRALVAGSSQEPLIPLARGEPARSAADQVPAFPQDWGFRVGSFRDDGSIDFRERNIFPPIRQGELLAECESVAVGTPGRTVFGIETEAVSGRVSLELIAGESVRLCTEGDAQRLYATSDGGVVLKSGVARDTSGAVVSRQYHMAVQPVVRIDSDVGYETGNIDFSGSVVIDGSVSGGFQVKATGGIAVGGSIEAGATLEAGGDITIQQGIVGRETRVTAEGMVSARFVQEARVETGADVAIGSYIHGAHIQARGRVLVEGLGGGGRDTGGIVGGHTWGLGGITTRNVGSARSSSTHLYAGVSPEDLARLEQLGESILKADAEIQRLLASLGLGELEAAAVRELLDRDPGRKDEVLQGVKRVKRLERARDRRAREEQELREQITRIATEAPVDVSGQAFCDVSVQIGERQLVLARDLCQVRFYMDPREPELGVGSLPAR